MSSLAVKQDMKPGASRHLPVAHGRERHRETRHDTSKVERPSEPRLQAAVARKGGESEPYDANVPCTD